MRRITRAALQLDDAIDRLAQEEVLESARKLCHLRGLIVVPLGLDKVDDNGEAPLYWAATRGGTDDVRILLDAGANVNALLSFSAATLQREAPEEVENYDAVAVQASEMVAETRYSALHGAAMNGRAETVEMLLKRGADINMCVSGSGRWPTGCSALMLASANGCKRVVERLLAYNACTEKRGESGYTALMLAARNGKAKVVQMLLSKGADVKAVREVTLMDSSKTITTTALDLAQRSRAGGIEGAAECVELLTKHLS
jgi:ankyrin repeat protein